MPSNPSNPMAHARALLEQVEREREEYRQRVDELEAENEHLRTILESIEQFLDRGDEPGIRMARQAVRDIDRPDDT